MTFQPKYLILHDYGTNNAYGGGNIGFNPYHALVRGGQVQYRYPDNPYGQSAPHAYRLNPQAIGLSWYGPSGGKPNEADLAALKSEVARIKQQFPDIQVMSHGQAYVNRGSLPQASKLGRGLDEAAWRSALGFGDAPAMTDVPQGPTPMAQRGLTTYAGLRKTPQEAPSMPTYKDVGGQVPQMAPGTSPADVAHAQAMAKMLMQGGQGQPRHWAQALGNAMQQLVGGLWQEQAARGEREGQAGANAALAAALSGDNPNWTALMQDPRTRDIGVKGLMDERELRIKMADPLYRAKIEEAQMNAAQARSGLEAQRSLFDNQAAAPAGIAAPVAEAPPVEGVGRFANANIMPKPDEPLIVEFGGKRIPLEKAQRTVAALAGSNPRLSQALGKEVDKAVRTREMQKMGIDPDSAEGQVYMLTGKVPTKAYEKMANEAKKQERAANIAGGLGELRNLTKDFDDTSFESAVGPYQGAEPDSLAGAVPINIARAFGEIGNWWGKGGSSPSEVRSAIRGSTEALAAAIKPLIRGPGEGVWTDADQARLVSVVGDLPQASTKKEFLSRLNRVRDRVKSNFGIDIPFDAFAGQQDKPAEDDGWRNVGGRRIREVR